MLPLLACPLVLQLLCNSDYFQLTLLRVLLLLLLLQ